MRTPLPRHALRHPAAIAAVVLGLTLAAVPFLPDRAGKDAAQGKIEPAADGARTPGRGVVTAEMRAEIERVVAAGASLSRTDGRTSSASAAAAASRCASFEGQRYCLGVGWTNRSQDEVAERMSAWPATRSARERTGDLGPTALLARATGRREAARIRAERAELVAAAKAVGKVWMLRHEIQGVPLPRGFAQAHPEVSARAFGENHPERFSIIKGSRSLSQNRTYWCGPATMQAIGWGSSKERTDQAVWARRLRTSSAGTAITDMVRVVNNHTKYDRKKFAGTYIALDIGDFTFHEWYRLMMRHIHGYRAPVVLHPVLLKQYYPYLDDDASGHFQVGRGFDQNTGGNRKIGYFEPWDQSRFDPSEPAIDRVQWRNAYKSYRANLDHFQQNIGV